MTIAIGFACKNAFIMASDSQMSVSDGTFKRWDEPKISTIEFQNGIYAVLGVAGALESASYFRGLFEEEAQNTPVLKAQTIAATAEIALKKTRKKILDHLDDGHTTPEQKQEQLRMLNFAALLAFWFQGKYHCFRSEFYHGLMQPARRPFEAIGCGNEIASFVLAGCDLPKCDIEEALGLVVYAIDRCKRFDSFCGGPIQHKIVSGRTEGFPFSLPPWFLEIYDRAASNLDKCLPATIKGAIRAEAAKEERRFLDEIEKAQRPPNPRRLFERNPNPSSEPRPTPPKPDPLTPPASQG